MLRGTMTLLVLTSLTNAANAFTCRLEVEGLIFMDGACDYEEDSDGTFRAFDKGNDRMFVYTIMNGDGTAQGYWPGPDGGTHAHDNLGTLARDGACWRNEYAKVCAWR